MEVAASGQNLVELIEKSCEEWAEKYATRGGLGFPDRLSSRGVLFYNLDHDSLCSAVVGLARVMHHPRHMVEICEDHEHLWAWVGELFFGPHIGDCPFPNTDYGQLLAAVLHAVLASTDKPVESFHADKFLVQSSLIAGYLSFPLLEATLKRACSAYIDLDGNVIGRFAISNRTYRPGNRCSNLAHLLWLLYDQVASPKLKAHLTTLKRHIESIENAPDAFKLIYKWRNDFGHGSQHLIAIGTLILHVALLVLICELEANYENVRSRASEYLQYADSKGAPSTWSFYPPR